MQEWTIRSVEMVLIELTCSPWAPVKPTAPWRDRNRTIIFCFYTCISASAFVVPFIFLTLSPFCPTRPAGPGKPRSPRSPLPPCKKEINIYRHTLKKLEHSGLPVQSSNLPLAFSWLHLHKKKKCSWKKTCLNGWAGKGIGDTLHEMFWKCGYWLCGIPSSDWFKEFLGNRGFFQAFSAYFPGLNPPLWRNTPGPMDQCNRTPFIAPHRRITVLLQSGGL